MSVEEFRDPWYPWAVRCRHRLFIKAAKMLKRHLPKLLMSYFMHRIPNATIEGFDSDVQHLKQAAHGVRCYRKHRTQILFFFWKADLRQRLPCY